MTKTIALLNLGMMLLLPACTSIVKKPEILEVKKVAIVSIYGNDRIYREGHTDFTSDWDIDLKQRVALQAYQAFSGEFKKLGWQVFNPSAILKSKEYAQAFKPPDVNDALGIDKESTVGRAIGFIQEKREEVYFNSFFTLKDMWPVKLKSNDQPQPYKIKLGGGDTPEVEPADKVLAKLATKYRLDAIAVVELRYCYKTGMLAIAGSGQGFILADSFVKMISKHGVLVVNMPEIQACGKDRIETDTGVGMWNGKIITGVSVAGIKVTDAKARFLQVFNEANKATARVTMEKIKKEL